MAGCNEKLDWIDGIFCGDHRWHIALFSECGGDPTDAIEASGHKEKTADGFAGGGAPLACTTVHTHKMDLGPRMQIQAHYICQIFQEIGLASETLVVTNASNPDKPTHYTGLGWISPCLMAARPEAWARRFED